MAERTPSTTWQQTRVSPLRITQQRRSPEQQLLADIGARSDKRAVDEQNSALGQIAALLAAVHPASKAIGAAPKIAEMLLAGSRHPAAISGGAGLGAMLSDNPGQGAIGGAMDMALGLPMATMLGTSDAQAGVLGDAAKRIGVPVFSALQRAFAQAPKQLENASGSQWAQWLEKNAGKLGVRKLEMGTSGIVPYLQGMGPEKVPRGALEQYAEQALPKIEKKVLGKPIDIAPRLQEIADEMNTATGERWSDLYKERARLADVYRRDFSPTKFKDRQLPGGLDYRETLLKLPRQEKTVNDYAQSRFGKDMRFLSEDEKDIVVGEMRSAHETKRDFTSQHWDDPNVLAHYRSNQRTDTEGNPVNFIEELQSDWAQKGRKDGFIVTESDRQSLMKQKDDIKARRREIYGDESKYDEMRELKAQEDEIDYKLRDPNLVPTAPFVTDTKDWTRLAVRNAIEDAVNQGHGNVAWTTGAQQAERYDLSKQVSKIDAMQNSDGTFWVNAVDNDGLNVLEKDKISKSELSDLVGKEMAEKIINQGKRESVSYSGVDLQVGGEGMKGYYDRIVPQVVEEYLRNAGVPTKVGKVSTLSAPSGPGTPVEQPGIRLTPEQITHIKEKGLPFYSAAPAVPLLQDQEEFRKGGLVQLRNRQ